MTSRISSVTITSLLLIIITGVESAVQSDEETLIKHLMRGYNKNIHPTILRNDSVAVELTVHLRRIILFNEREQAIQTDIWLSQKWKNELMTWNPNEHNNITGIRIQRGLLWLPDIYILQEIGNKTNMYLFDNTTTVHMSYDGTHQSKFPLAAYTTCYFNVLSFPYDEQECNISFTSWINDATRIHLSTASEFTLIDYKKSSAWELMSGSMHNDMRKYECCDKPYSTVTMHMKIKRKSKFYSMLMFFQSSLLCTTILLGFATPIDCRERIIFSLRVLLTLVFYIIEQLNQSLPINSQHLPVAGQFFTGINIIVSMSTFVTAFVTKMFYRQIYKLDTKYNPIEICLLKIGKYLPIIGVKCKYLLDTKSAFLKQNKNSPNRGYKNVETQEPQEEEEQKEQALQEKDDVEIVNILTKKSNQRRVKMKIKKWFNEYNARKYAIPVLSKQKKEKTLKSIITYLKTLHRSLQLSSERRKWKHSQTKYARAVVELMDRILMTTFILIIIVLFLTTVGQALIKRYL
ncbi:neuronal acetylcholine receptor subunit alpha-2-like [Hydractinia symbiolongicarpus]|uniref:neuronal acetylcholine receptor subunit alpha-2-like n=1 Tax=Hydractinia symbiolongicarpus TaxID=13093 RepID=UPI00254CBD8C|nr:neuronal acetylcholine receptor subunit alpha-2-like [Hydractinia symbiolongicarpus]